MLVDVGVGLACVSRGHACRAGVRVARVCGSLCRRAGVRVACSAARSLVRSLVDVGSLKNLSNKASDKYSYLRFLYLLKRHSFPVILIVHSCVLKTF